MLAGSSAAVPAGPSGSPISPADSTSAARVPRACPSWPPNRAPPSVLTIDCIGPSWPRISSGTRSPIAPTMRPATGSHSLRQTGSVWVTHSARLHACAVRMPDGSADAGSSHRSARCSASATAARSAALIGGAPGADGASGGGPGEPGKVNPPGPGRRMRRRGATLVVGAVVVLLLIVASFAGVRVPYVALTPGPTWNTLGTDHNKDVIQVSGGTVSRSGGQLRMVTVGVEDQLTLWDALRGWL